MKTYTSQDGIKIIVGENAKENDDLTLSRSPYEWWLHVDGGPGAHVIICHEGDTIPRETKRDAAFLAVHHSKSMSPMTHVNLVRIYQVIKPERLKQHGLVYLDGRVDMLTVFKNKEKPRLERLLHSVT